LCSVHVRQVLVLKPPTLHPSVRQLSVFIVILNIVVVAMLAVVVAPVNPVVVLASSGRGSTTTLNPLLIARHDDACKCLLRPVWLLLLLQLLDLLLQVLQLLLLLLNLHLRRVTFGAAPLPLPPPSGLPHDPACPIGLRRSVSHPRKHNPAGGAVPDLIPPPVLARPVSALLVPRSSFGVVLGRWVGGAGVVKGTGVVDGVVVTGIVVMGRRVGAGVTDSVVVRGSVAVITAIFINDGVVTLVIVAVVVAIAVSIIVVTVLIVPSLGDAFTCVVNSCLRWNCDTLKRIVNTASAGIVSTAAAAAAPGAAVGD
jgi:hypothetical protein